MDYHQKKLDLYTVQWNTSMRNHHRVSIIRQANAMQDKDQKERHEAQECPLCFYVSSRIGGAAMTTSNCAGCNKEMDFGSTYVDLLCPECAKALGLCKHCGADLDLKGRRKLDLTKIDTSAWPPDPPPQPRSTTVLLLPLKKEG
jgi:predicted RNA-binding Zn-ribbon protein involved in translation (DUF1610 family)